MRSILESPVVFKMKNNKSTAMKRQRTSGDVKTLSSSICYATVRVAEGVIATMRGRNNYTAMFT